MPAGAAAPLSMMDLHHAGDLVGLVAGALEVGRGLGDGDQQAQVARRGLAPRDDGRQLAVDLHFHRLTRSSMSVTWDALSALNCDSA
jgi:hypothetical protein